MKHDSGSSVSPSDPRYGEVLEFLYAEAELLDTGRFAEWLELLAPDLTYRMPIRLNAAGDHATGGTEIYSDSVASLRLRVERLTTGFAWSETPPSRTRHLVSNVRVRTTEDASELEVRSYFLVYRNRLNDPHADIFSGERQDLLRQADGGWRLASRTIVIDQAVIGAQHLSIFL